MGRIWSYNPGLECAEPEIVEMETDILLVGGGMACCGAAVEAVRWAKPAGLKIVLCDKAALERSGAVAMGLSAINTYIGENKPDDYVRMVRCDLMGIIREDLSFDVGRHVDDTVHCFEDWGLPIWKTTDDGKTIDGAEAKAKGLTLRGGAKPVRSGRWQIMINGESYKVIVAEAAKNAMDQMGENGVILERVFIVRPLMDANEPNRCCGGVGFSVRENKVYIIKANATLVATGGAVNIFRPRSVGEGQGRAWYPVWNPGSGYAMFAMSGAKLVLMENRFVPARFKDGYGPVGAWFLLFKARATNAFDEDYIAKHKDELKKFAPYSEASVVGTCLRNHAMLIEMKEGRGPIFMHTEWALQESMKNMDKKEFKKLEAEAWEDFLDMCVTQAGLWACLNIEPEKVPSEIMPTEPYFLGSHAGCAGAWCCGPDEDWVPEEYRKAWDDVGRYNRMTTVKGMFAAGDTVGACGHKFSSGSHVEGRIAAKAMIKFCLDNKDFKPTPKENPEELKKEIYGPWYRFQEFKNATTVYEINPNYLLPRQIQLRLMKIMDEYVAGIATYYQTNKIMLERGLELLTMLKEDMQKAAARDLHELMRAWENIHRVWTAELHLRHVLFREETRYPGYYYRADFPELDDQNWRCFTLSRWNPETGEWEMEKFPYIQIIPDPLGP
ncbi:adenylyl-sulfate reductase subunit alpha [Thermosulfurimonas dismutans]|uniref:Adenylylsulfate reductase alpha-subunit n=1 Tax=Thermosulfurimonas dismutans TaxID=999894 RepID=A0A179D3W6_9BACT|nr:adenylyl-sulfate reductase subunit alpha [Thermosulfurimonas dismutans]OAQ20318.1 Adenylylsulfate reductase alpha-subunit [Thermosulfurimonas dismutans]